MKAQGTLGSSGLSHHSLARRGLGRLAGPAMETGGAAEHDPLRLWSTVR
jgi:hypothetical protein